MNFLRTYKYPVSKQYLISSILIIITSIISYFSVEFIGYQVVALMFLMMVSLLAMLFDILPVLISAFVSALIWNFFFIQPTLTFHIGTPEDVLMFLMYFVIALINVVLTYKIRQYERKVRSQEEKEKSIRLYNTLLSSLSHELRTPISTIIGAIDTVQDADSKITEANKKDLFKEIEIAGLRLNKQVENLLSMSRLEAGIIKLKLDWTDVNEIVFSVIKECEADLIDHAVIFEPDESLPLFKLDSVLVEQIIYNILFNAIQHTPKGTEIRISVNVSPKGCEFIIEDNGEGFPKEEKSNVFNKFYRLKSSRTGGTGLGLSIAKGFTEVMDGKIELQDRVPKGAKFVIHLPCEKSMVKSLSNE